jgi:hypothetical protein
MLRIVEKIFLTDVYDLELRGEEKTFSRFGVFTSLWFTSWAMTTKEKLIAGKQASKATLRHKPETEKQPKYH